MFHQPPCYLKSNPFYTSHYKSPRRATQRASRIYEKVAHQETRHCSTPKSHVCHLTRLVNVDDIRPTQPLSRDSQTCSKLRLPRPYGRVSRRIFQTSRVSSKWRSRGITPSRSPKLSPISFRYPALPLFCAPTSSCLWPSALSRGLWLYILRLTVNL